MAIHKPIAVLVVAAAAVGGAWWALRTVPEEAPKHAPTPEPSPEPKPSKSPVMTVDFLPEPEAKVPTERRLKMPDGSFVPTLNGVVNPAPIAWGSVPYSPIVRKQIDPTVEWYVHADGTYTTTIMQWRSDLKRNDACTVCLHPEKPTATEPVSEGEGAPKKQQ
jgi:hypothetical protein